MLFTVSGSNNSFGIIKTQSFRNLKIQKYKVYTRRKNETKLEKTSMNKLNFTFRLIKNDYQV